MGIGSFANEIGSMYAVTESFALHRRTQEDYVRIQLNPGDVVMLVDTNYPEGLKLMPQYTFLFGEQIGHFFTAAVFRSLEKITHEDAEPTGI